MPKQLEIMGNTIAYEDLGGNGPVLLLIPGAGDTMSEYRAIAPELAKAGNRVVTMDLRGHGASGAGWKTYDVAGTSSDIVALLELLDAGPATVVGTSFAPAAALWAASDRPDLIERLILISAHLHAAPAFQGALLRLALRGPLAGSIWSSTYRKWYPGAEPADQAEHVGELKRMMRDPQRREAVREMLTADRDGLAGRIAKVNLPTLVIMGGADSHFADPEAEGREIAGETGGDLVVVPNAGHYPHAEFPEIVASEIASFLEQTAR